MRIAIAGLLHETNTFANGLTDEINITGVGLMIYRQVIYHAMPSGMKR